MAIRDSWIATLRNGDLEDVRPSLVGADVALPRAFEQSGYPFSDTEIVGEGATMAEAVVAARDYYLRTRQAPTAATAGAN